MVEQPQSQRKEELTKKKDIIGCSKPSNILALILISGILAAIFLPGYFAIKLKYQRSEAKRKLHIIKEAVDDFALENNGYFPLEIEAIITEGFLQNFPDNYYSREPMKCIQFGDADFSGNFTYWPVIVEERVIGYYLAVYQNDSESRNYGFDLIEDGVPGKVLLVLHSQNDEEGELPPLKDLL